MKYGISFTKKAIERKEIIKPEWIILESCFTISFVSKHDILKSVKECNTDEKLRVYTSSEYLDYCHMVTLKYLSLDVFMNHRRYK